MGKTAGEDEEYSDRISELPEPILHHILRFLPSARDVARITALSKHWKRVFESYPSFHFDERWFTIREAEPRYGRLDRDALRHQMAEERKRFKEYVVKSLATRLHRLQCADDFRLRVGYCSDIQFLQCAAGWIRAAIAKKVKELVVDASAKDDYALPIDLTEASSINFMKLTGDALYGLASMKMCNLRRIWIKWARFLDSDLMKKLEENCPLLEDFRIIYCENLSNLEISSLVKLKRVEVLECQSLNRIQISAPNLETFWFHSDEYQNCTIYLRNLRNLTLKDGLMSDSAFQDLISMSPFLEKLELRECSKIEKLSICSNALKSLALFRCSKLDEVDVDAPNLLSFQYEGRVMLFPLVSAPRLSEVKLCFYPCKKRLNPKHERFFCHFDGSKGVRLIIYTKKTMKIFEEPREVDFLRANNVCRMELTASSPLRVVKNVENWLKEKRGMSLVLISPNVQLLELIKALIIEREDSPTCCENYSNKCWRHFIKDVNVSTPESVEKITYDITWKPKIKKKRWWRRS